MQTKHIDVKEAPFNGAKPPDHGTALTSPATKLLLHCGKFSAGLRIRTHPSLQSEQIGFVPINGIVGYTDEVSDIIILIFLIIIKKKAWYKWNTGIYFVKVIE